jgi:single-strand DNA-binding protein
MNRFKLLLKGAIQMASVNKVMLMGNLTRDPELRYTSSGQPVCNFSLAMNRYFKDKEGERKEETTFMRITVWGKQGENCAQYLSKGRAAFVEGRLDSRSWEDDEGNKRTAVDVVAENVQFLGGPRDSDDSDTDAFDTPDQKKKKASKSKAKGKKDIPF